MDEDTGGDNDGRMLEWENGLPDESELTPLLQNLVPLELALAFSITAEPCRSMGDVIRASEMTVLSLCGRQDPFPCSSSNLELFPSRTPLVYGEEDEHELTPRTPVMDDMESRKIQKIDYDEDVEVDSSMRMLNSSNADNQSAGTFKRPRLVWTPPLHKRFVEVVMHLGVKNAVPKTIMQLMNVEGLTRENVASHLQKYRLYLKRNEGEGLSTSDNSLFSQSIPRSTGSERVPLSTTPAPPTPTQLERPPTPPPPQMSYGGLPLLPISVLGTGLAPNSQAGIKAGNSAGVGYPGGYKFHHYNLSNDQQRDTPGITFDSMLYPHVSNTDR
ncbi:hypothetical protein C5167_003113 [Papaver somniferum]|uniref:HTH myb-type domain-containing protein n=1 Tax=Papaver somniferum TaxID=3469 RepID=A0A4Y7L3C3_PAPSO|nr:transcription factor LUX-like [Papaver somniferum]RZC78918.1 hypothetical protein C5167_003113 [Papaver somniferum]